MGCGNSKTKLGAEQHEEKRKRANEAKKARCFKRQIDLDLAAAHRLKQQGKMDEMDEVAIPPSLSKHEMTRAQHEIIVKNRSAQDHW